MEQQSSSSSHKQEDEDKVNVGDVRKNWRMFEDFGVAYTMQQDEFANHYDHNRFERRTMHVDTKLSKNEQKLEDKYAAEYYEQLRLDMEKDDERLAMQLQQELELEERKRTRSTQSDLSKDEELARKLQEAEEIRTGKRATPSNLIKRSASGNRLVLPPGLTPETIAAIEEAQRDGTPLRLPVGLTSEQLKAIRYALKDEDQRLAQEVQDYELALYLQKKEKDLIDAERQRRLSQEQVQNLQNQTYVAATRGTLIDSTVSPPKHPMQNGSSVRIPPRPNVTMQQKSDSDLICFDDESAQSPPDPFSSPKRPPPPIFQTSIDNTRFVPHPPPPPLYQPSVSLACSDHYSPGNPFVNLPPAADVRNRDPVAMGGIQVFPKKHSSK